MANDKHYPKGSAGGKGGQFAPKEASESGNGAETGKARFRKKQSAPGAETGKAIDFIPKTTRSGKPRIFFPDLPEEQQEKMEKEYFESHKEILKYNNYLYDHHNTNKINTLERDFLRAKLVNDEIESQMSKGPKAKGRKAFIVLGLPGSGKSTITKPLMESEKAFSIDADDFKARIPEFVKDPKMVSAVHYESVRLSKNMMDELSEEGYNMVVGKVGGDLASVKPYIDMLAKSGYEIHEILVDIPFEEAVERAIGRYDRGETDRFVPFYTIKTADKNVLDTFDKILELPEVSSGKIYSNDVDFGESPILLKEINKK